MSAAALANAFPGNGLSLIQPSTLRYWIITRTGHSSAVEFQHPAAALPAGLSLMVGYVGSSSTHLPVGQNDADMCPLLWQRNRQLANICFPPPERSRESIPTSATSMPPSSTVMPYHALQTNVEGAESWIDDAGYLYLVKSLDNGSTTFSQNETLNSTDNGYIFDQRILRRFVSDFDVPQSFAINVVWEIPTPASLPGASRAVISGWQVGGIFTAQSGSPFSVGLQGDKLEPEPARPTPREGKGRIT